MRDRLLWLAPARALRCAGGGGVRGYWHSGHTALTTGVRRRHWAATAVFWRGVSSDSIGQISHVRADCENGFSALKTQWGPSGFATCDINRCQPTAKGCALVYTW